MKHIKKFNENVGNIEKTLRDLIGDIKEEINKNFKKKN